MMKETEKRSDQNKQLILAVECVESFCRMIRKMTDKDYRVKTIRDGDEALAFIRSSIEEISLIMVDIQTTGSSGLRLLKTLKNDPMMCRLPVIVLTMEKAFEAECLRIGASDVIQLPCELPEVVLARIKRSIKQTEQTGVSVNSDSDELTEILNQDAFFRYAEQYDALYPDAPMDAVCVDISSFHIINELFGREEGSRILVALAQAIREIAQENNCIAGRKAADIFLLYIPHQENYEEIMSRLQASMTETFGNTNMIRLKMGIYPDVDKSLAIEARFDRAKHARDTLHYSFSRIIAYYDGEKYRENLMFQQLMREMDSSLRERHFTVYYQPKFDIRGETPELISAEALVRWQHPTLGLIYPGMFVSLFEKNGLITELDRYIWNETASQIRRWRDRYGVTLPVSVNVSRVDMFEDDLADYFTSVIEKNGLTPRDLMIEITESAYTKDSEQLIDQINKLRAAGFLIEMDDFGSGYSSLNMLSSVSIDIIKLDIAFIRNMFGGERNMQMLHLMMQIKDSLQIPLVAEGVETEEQLIQLKELGCDIVQGYYFSKPLPPEEFEKYIREKASSSG